MTETEILDSAIDQQLETLRQEFDMGYSVVDRFRLTITLIEKAKIERNSGVVFRPFYDSIIQKLFEQKEDLERQMVLRS